MKEISVGTPVTIGEITIIPLVEISTYHNNNRDMLSVYVSKEPVGIVVGSRQSKWAIDIDGRQVPLETYTRKINGLQQTLDSL